MIGILKVEFFRLKRSTAFWVCFGLCIGLLLISMLFLLLTDALLESWGETDDLLFVGGGVFYYTQDLTSYASDVNILALICTAVILCGEFGGGTIRNMILANKSRRQIFGAFCIFALIVGTIFYFTYFACILLFFGPTFGFYGLAVGQAIITLLCHFAMGLTSLLCVQSFVMMFLFVTKRTSQTILFPMLLALFLPDILSLLVSLFASLVDVAVSETFFMYLPFVNWSTLDMLNPNGANVGMVLLYNLILAAVFLFVAYKTCKRSDIK